MNLDEINKIVAQIERFPGLMCDDKNLEYAFLNFQEVLVDSIKRLRSKAEKEQNHRVSAAYRQEIIYLTDRIKNMVDF